MTVTSFNPDGIPLPPPTYRQVAITTMPANGKLITLAGQTGTDPQGRIVDGIREQSRVAYGNVLKCLKAAGATPKDIVHVRHYIVCDSGSPEENKVDIVDRGWGEEWIEFMKTHGDGNLPPDTVLGVCSLAKKALQYEVECWAFLPES